MNHIVRLGDETSPQGPEMAERKKTDHELREKRVQRDLKVLRYLYDNVGTMASGRLESPEKLVLFYAGYTAIRSIWDARTCGGKKPTGNRRLDEEMKNETGKLVFRVNMEVSHSIGKHSKTLLRVVTFKYWAKRVLKQWET